MLARLSPFYIHVFAAKNKTCFYITKTFEFIDLYLGSFTLKPILKDVLCIFARGNCQFILKLYFIDSLDYVAFNLQSLKFGRVVK